MSDGLRVAIIGTGAIARDQHIPGWMQLPECRVVALADISLPAVQHAGKMFQIERCETDYRRLLDDRSIDVVDVCCPSALHASVVTAALAAGKHVLCEKPLATSRGDVAQILAAYASSGQKLMAVQQMRADPRTLALRDGLASYPLGDVYYARAQWLRRRRVPARPGFIHKELSGGGPLYDLGVHLVDLAWWLMDCPTPTTASGAVFSHLAHSHDVRGEWGHWNAESIDVEDFAAGSIRFANGSLLSLEVSWLAFQSERDFSRLHLFGTRAGALWPDCRLFGETAGKPWDMQLAPGRVDKPHREVIRQFARAVLDDRPVPVDPIQSANVIAMLDALYRSAELQREVSVERF